MQYCFELLTPHNLAAAAAFVQKHEYRCVNLAEQLRLCGVPGSDTQYKLAALLSACPQRHKICCGVLLFSRQGILLHCIDTALPQELIRSFWQFFLNHGFVAAELHAVAGIRAHTLLLEQLILQTAAEARIDAAIDYFLMRRIGACAETFCETAQRKLGVPVSAARAAETDLDELFPLQFDYETTEVAYGDRRIDPTVCRLSLRLHLRNERIYKVTVSGCIAAKASVNAQGFHWFQIGGVYTVPEYRNNGLAAAALAQLIAANRTEACGFALFVKTANAAAVRVYEKLGFERCGLFRMSYWKRKSRIS
nr:GNAT family N-acetyltransferase [uncultured Treponema sp.]